MELNYTKQIFNELNPDENGKIIKDNAKMLINILNIDINDVNFVKDRYSFNDIKNIIKLDGINNSAVVLINYIDLKNRLIKSVSHDMAEYILEETYGKEKIKPRQKVNVMTLVEKANELSILKILDDGFFNNK
jgi:hypothetical protein